MVMKLRGGGTVPLPDPEMSVGAGGPIHQSIIPDPFDPSSWDLCGTLSFNAQIVNSEIFRSITKRDPPPTPISARTYAESGFPFFKLYEEMSPIAGNFEGLKSVAQIAKEELHKMKPDGADAHTNDSGQEPSHHYPLVIVNPQNGPKVPFRPVDSLENALRAINHASF